MIQTPALLSARIPDAPAPLARLGQFEVRLARTAAERHAAWRLRYEVFYRERGADAPWMDHDAHIEADRFDGFCEHVIVIDSAAETPDESPAIVGTYRVMREPAPGLGYYADGEFALDALFARHRHMRFCEVGRSCVAPAYRSMRTIEALWCGLWAYAARHGIDAYIGAASFAGTDPRRHALALSYLRHFAAAGPDWSVPVRGGAGVAMDILPRTSIDRHAALRAMPPLVRGYLRLNARFSSEAFIDHAFGTTDVLVAAPLAAAPKAYRQRIERVTGIRHPHIA
ncbi:GNAT family N-acetyltransferase [Pelagibacterium lacus]|uniref:L-ornithine N(alpha)-acyltransferase n=1 Tax=Pelagibacterium lacus TaxID=2282655 RepID=A0A369W471_9HYPH|nr:GNAT family N-acyltransferase [Pelagibacterium lacus]RDE09496.1 GNAT family N-acetyltransferase [Pelagibacterium lacus]